MGMVRVGVGWVVEGWKGRLGGADVDANVD